MADQEIALSPIRQMVEEGTPFQRLLGETLHELGGVEFMVEWAEDYPEQFMRVLMAANPAAVLGGQTKGGGTTLNVILPQGCGPGPLDEVVSHQ